MTLPQHEARRKTIVLPGGRFATERLADVPRIVGAAALLTGPLAHLASRRSRRGQPRTAERKWASAAQRLLRVEVIASGLHHVDAERRYVVAPLHEGFADALALLTLPLDLRFVARDELREWGLLGRALVDGHHIGVTPESGVAAYREMLRRAPAALDQGESLVVFPQGSILGVETAFAPGAFRFARRLDVPLLPVVLSGSHRVWEHPFSPVVRPRQRIFMQVLPAVAPEEAEQSARSLERRMKSLALESAAPPRRYVPERDGWWDGYEFTIDPDYSHLAERVAVRRAMVAPTVPTSPAKAA